MEMDGRTMELKSHVEKALKHGAKPEEVAMAIEMGNRVRKGAAAKMDEISASLTTSDAPKDACVVMEGNGYQFLGP